MNRFIHVPSKGQPMTAQWGADVANGLNSIRSAGQNGMLLTDGPTGTGFANLPANLRDRRQYSAVLHPWKVFAGAENEERTWLFEVYVPAGSLSIDGSIFSSDEISGLTPVSGKTGFFTADCLDGVSPEEPTDFFLLVYQKKSESEEEEFDEPSAEICLDTSSAEDFDPETDKLVAFLPIASVTVHEDDDGNRTGKINLQYVCCTQAFNTGSAAGPAGGTDKTCFRVETVEIPPEDDEEEDEEEEPTSVKMIVDNYFMFDGELYVCDDYEAPSDGTVYLVMTQEKPSSGEGEPEWEMELSTEEGEAPEGGRVVNYPLYDFENGEVVLDYRDTFLSLYSPHEKAKVVVEMPDAGESDPRIVEDTTFGDARLDIENGESSVSAAAKSGSASLSINGGDKSIELSTADIGDGLGDVSFHTLTIVNGRERKEFCVLSDKDITISLPSGGELLTDVTIELDDAIGGGRMLKLVKTFKDSSGNEREDASIITLKKIDVVESSTYDEEDGVFKNNTKTLTVFEADDESEEDEVFETEEHSAQS